MVQVLLIYFGIFASVNVPKLLVAVLAFGLNSARLYGGNHPRRNYER